MWTSTYSKVIKSVKKEAVWQRWTDVNHWHEWIPNVESCQLEKPFASGSSFFLKPKGSPSMTVELLNVKRDHSFTGCTRFFGATMYDIHEMHQDPQGIRLTVTLKVTGPLGFLWRKLVAEKIEANLPILLRNLASVLGAPDLKNPVLSDKQSTAIAPKPKLHVVSSGSQKQKQKPKSKPKKSKIKVSVSSLKKTNPLLQSIPNESEISNRKVAHTMSTQTKPKLVTSTSKPKTKSSTTKNAKPASKKTTVKKVAAKKSTTATKTVKAKTTASSAKKKTVKAKLKLVTAKKTAPKKKSSLTKTTKAKSSTSSIKKKTAKPAKSKSLTATKTSSSPKSKPKAKAKSKAKGK